jgi:hypothetical protein
MQLQGNCGNTTPWVFVYLHRTFRHEGSTGGNFDVFSFGKYLVTNSCHCSLSQPQLSPSMTSPLAS